MKMCDDSFKTGAMNNYCVSCVGVLHVNCKIHIYNEVGVLAHAGIVFWEKGLLETCTAWTRKKHNVNEGRSQVDQINDIIKLSLWIATQVLFILCHRLLHFKWFDLMENVGCALNVGKGQLLWRWTFLWDESANMVKIIMCFMSGK